MPTTLLYASLGQALSTQQPDITLERYQRWTLYSESGAKKSALLFLFVRNNTSRLVREWRAIMVARDSLGREMFRVAIARDSADLEPNEIAQVDVQFENRPERPGEPYDNLMGTDTTNIRLSFDAVRVTLGGAVRYLRPGSWMCFDSTAYRAAERARYSDPGGEQWQTVSDEAGCQSVTKQLAVEILRSAGSRGAVVRIKRMPQRVWVFTEDLSSEQSDDNYRPFSREPTFLLLLYRGGMQ